MNPPLVNQDVLEAFIKIYLRNPHIEDKHTAMAEELGLTREEAKLQTYRLMYNHISLRYIAEIGNGGGLFKATSYLEKNPSGTGLFDFLEEQEASCDEAMTSLRQGKWYSSGDKALLLNKLKRSRADTNI